MKDLTLIQTKDHQDWLALRKQGIGGSDAAAIVGLNDYVSPYMLYLDKIGELEEKDTNEAMRQGTDLEDYVAKRFCEKTGKRVRRRTQTIKNKKYPFALANVDRWIVGENAGLECKTTSTLNLHKFKDGEFPANYYIQCMHYMAVTGADKYYLAVLIFGKDFLVFEFDRDEELIEDLMTAEEDFWEHVKSRIPPSVDGSDSTDRALRDQYTETEDITLDLFGMNGRADELIHLKSEKKEIDKQIKQIEQEFKSTLGNAIKGETDCFQISWKPQNRKTFQLEKFKTDHPDIDLTPYYKEQTSRVFRIKELV